MLVGLSWKYAMRSDIKFLVLACGNSKSIAAASKAPLIQGNGQLLVVSSPSTTRPGKILRTSYGIGEICRARKDGFLEVDYGFAKGYVHRSLSGLPGISHLEKGTDVITKYGKGRIIEIRPDSTLHVDLG